MKIGAVLLLAPVLFGATMGAVQADAAEVESAGLSPQDFAYGMDVVTSGDAAAYRFPLPLDVYQKVVRADLNDVRVFNAHGEVVPFAIERPRAETTVQHGPTPLPVFTLRGDPRKALDTVRIDIETGNTSVHVQTTGVGTTARTGASADTGASTISSYVLDSRALDAPVAGFQVTWPDDAADFAGRMQVEASDDLGAWRAVVSAAPIANLRAGDARLVERRVELPATRSKFWRLSWVGAAAPFEITSVVAEPAQDRVDVERATLAVIGAPVVDEPAKASASNSSANGSGAIKPGEFEFDLRAHVPADRVNVELPEQNSVVEVALFSRAGPTDAWRLITRSGFYRLRSSGADLANGAITVEPNADRYWLARADVRGGGLGNGAPRLRVGWVPHDVVFLARGAGPFTLAYGSGAHVRPMGSLASIPSGVAIVGASLSAPRVLGGDSRLQLAAATPAPFNWKSTLLWAALAIGVALLAFMAYRLSRELKSPS